MSAAGIIDCQTYSAPALLDVLERLAHSSQSEWLFLRELRVGTGHRNSSSQRLDAFALNCLPHQAMKRVCYEVKVSRADFLGELRHPLKRRIGMRYSNEFYFVTPPALLQPAEIPVDCGLLEIGKAGRGEWTAMLEDRAGDCFHDPDCHDFCRVVVPAPWRDTPGPTWQCCATSAAAWRARQHRLPLSNAWRSTNALRMEYKDAYGSSYAEEHR